MRIQKHPNLDLWCREDGAVCLPPCPKYPHYRFTFGSKNGTGYLYVRFQGKCYRVHRLIAETFLDNPNGYKEVDHKNRVKTANFVANLRWANRNMQSNNRQVCEDSKAKYGVRECDCSAAYQRAYRAKNPEIAERRRAECSAYRAKQKALGRHFRTCPDGKRRWLTDEEFAALYG